jgi:hypothetical protein
MDRTAVSPARPRLARESVCAGVSGIPFGHQPLKYLFMLTVILFLAGFVCFYLFFKSIDYFENI